MKEDKNENEIYLSRKSQHKKTFKKRARPKYVLIKQKGRLTTTMEENDNKTRPQQLKVIHTREQRKNTRPGMKYIYPADKNTPPRATTKTDKYEGEIHVSCRLTIGLSHYIDDAAPSRMSPKSRVDGDERQLSTQIWRIPPTLLNQCIRRTRVRRI